MPLRNFFCAFFLASPAIAADVALVDSDLGQALLFENRGLCYAVLPNHVSVTKNRISLAIPAPAAHGSGEIFWRAPDTDLALAFVEGDVAERCTVQYRELTSDLSSRLQTTETGFIKSVHFDGAFFDRIGAAIIDVDDRFVSVRITGAGVDAGVMQGLSGAMLTVGGQIAGIAVDATSTGEARFLRMDMIAGMLGPKIAQGTHPIQRTIAKAETGKGFRVTGFNGEGDGVVALEPSSLSSPWRTTWAGKPIVFEITLSNDTLVPLNRVALVSEPSDESTPARRIGLEVDRGLPGTAYWTAIASPDMSPTGKFEAFTGGTVARRVRIRIEDVWFPDRDLRLDQLIVE